MKLGRLTLLPFPILPLSLNPLPPVPSSYSPSPTPLPLPCSLPLPFPSPPFPPFPPFALEVGPLCAARGSGGALKFPQRVRAEPGRQTFSGAYRAENPASDELPYLPCNPCSHTVWGSFLRILEMVQVRHPSFTKRCA